MLEMAKIRRALVLVGTWIIKRLLRAGVPMGPMILLTVRGRATGQPRTTPVDLLERNGRRWLVATHGGASSNWVRNLRAAGEGILTRGRRRQPVTAVELSPEAAGTVLKEVLELARRRLCADLSFDAPWRWHQTPPWMTSSTRPVAIRSLSLHLGPRHPPRRRLASKSTHQTI